MNMKNKTRRRRVEASPVEKDRPKKHKDERTKLNQAPREKLRKIANTKTNMSGTAHQAPWLGCAAMR